MYQPTSKTNDKTFPSIDIYVSYIFFPKELNYFYFHFPFSLLPFFIAIFNICDKLWEKQK